MWFQWPLDGGNSRPRVHIRLHSSETMEKAGIIARDGNIYCQREASNSHELYQNTTACEHNGASKKIGRPVLHKILHQT